MRTRANLFTALVMVTSAACQATPPPAPPPASAPTPRAHLEDVIYGRKYGLSLTLDVFLPPRPNGAGILALDTGGWTTDYDHIWDGAYVHYLERGYTVFQVVHGSAPKFTVPEEISDVRRAVKFIRFHAAEYKVDPDRLGITGNSTGGHLSLMMGSTDTADPEAKDPVERMSSRVRAVACFAPLTDLTKVRWPMRGSDRPDDAVVGPYTFLDFMEKPRSRILMGSGRSPGTGPSVVHVVTDADKGAETLRAISPVEQASSASAPTMIIQGEKDRTAPVEDTQRFLAKLSAAGVPTKLVLLPGAGHMVPDEIAHTAELADWFDAYLKPRAAPAGAAK